MYDRDRLEEIISAAVAAGLAAPEKRSLLLGAFPEAVARSLTVKKNPLDQLRSDVLELGRLGKTQGVKGPPLLHWLRNAASCAAPDHQPSLWRFVPRLGILQLPPLGLDKEGGDPLAGVLNELRGRIPDLVLCAGLTTDASAAAFERAKQVVAPFVGEYIDRLYAVPGPGDCDGVAGAGRTALIGIADVFENPLLMNVLLAGFGGFKEFHDQLARGCFTAERPFALRQDSVAGLRVEVLGLNTAWSLAEPWRVGTEIVAKHAKSFAAGNLRILLSYHAMDSWDDADRAAAAPLVEAADLVLSAVERPQSAKAAGVPPAGYIREALIAARCGLAVTPEGYRAYLEATVPQSN